MRFLTPTAWSRSFILLLVAASLGCGGEAKLVPVQGKITVNGEPLTSGTLVLKPDRDKGNLTTDEPAGTIQKDGTYTIYTNYKPGAPLGAYKVAVEASVAVNPDAPYPERKSLIDARYNDAQRSGLTLQIVERPEAGAYDLRLSR